MLAALTAADSPDDLEVAQQLLKLGNVNACSRQVITEPPQLGFCEECFISGLKSQTWIACATLSVSILLHLPSSNLILIPSTSHSLFRRRARQRSCSQWATAVLPWWSCSLAVAQTWTSRTTRAPQPWCAPASTGTLTSSACCWRRAAVTSASQTRWQSLDRRWSGDKARSKDLDKIWTESRQNPHLLGSNEMTQFKSFAAWALWIIRRAIGLFLSFIVLNVNKY